MKLFFTLVTLTICFQRVTSAEWSCTAASPETSGTFTCTNDCTMASAGVTFDSGDTSITGRSSLTTITAKTSGNRRHFKVLGGVTLTLKWLNLTGGNAAGYPITRGGSIYVDASTLHATSCVFFLNTASGEGGAVYNSLGGSVQLYHSNITGNTASSGGGVHSTATHGASSTVVQDSIIADNTAGSGGGGIGQSKGTLTITRSVIKDNRQTTGTSALGGGGGVYIVWGAVVAIRESTLDQNHAAGSNNGHQIFAYKSDSQGGAPAVTVVNTRFIPCTACETTGTNFYLYDQDTTSNSGAAAYGTSSRKICSDSPCSVSPFAGACVNRTDDPDYGVTCAYSSCGGGTYGNSVTVNQSSLPPVATCMACPAGKFSNASMSSCADCNAGSITDTGVNTGATTCTACTAGKYSTASNVPSCTDCLAGTYHNQNERTQSSDCSNCAAGSITDTGTSAGATTCTACAAGKYSTASNVSSCTDCNAGSITDTGVSTGATTCTACTAGKYSTASNVSACTNCAAGSITDTGASAGATTCTVCGAGKYSSASNVSACTNCSTGTYHDQTSRTQQSDCQTCPSGSITDASTGATTCTTPASVTTTTALPGESDISGAPRGMPYVAASGGVMICLIYNMMT